MLEFSQQDSYTLFDAFANARAQAAKLKRSVPKKDHGRLAQYLDITSRIEEHVKPENFTLPGLNTLLDEFDDGKSRTDPEHYPEPAPFVETEGEYEFAKILHAHLDFVLNNLDKLDISAFAFYQRPFMRWGIGKMGPKMVKVLEDRIEGYEQSLTQTLEVQASAEAITHHFETTRSSRSRRGRTQESLLDTTRHLATNRV